MGQHGFNPAIALLDFLKAQSLVWAAHGITNRCSKQAAIDFAK